MFFSGTLQEALASAVQNNKAVLCFVTDDGEESQRWESDFLVEDSVAQSIASAAVALRLKAGSQEAGYLTAIFPLPKIPTVVILRNGELKEYIPAGTSKDDFSRRVQSVLSASAAEPLVHPAAAAPSPQEQGVPATAPAPAPVPAAPVRAPAPQPAPSPAAVSSATEGAPARGGTAPPAPGAVGSDSIGVQNFLAERAARLEQQRAEAKKRALEAYARAQAKGKEKADADANSDDKDKPKKGSRDEMLDAVKRRQRDAKEERKRILKRIEDDKAARRELLAESKSRQNTPTDISSGPSTSAAMSSDKAAILVRLHDGSTLRSRFAKGSSIRQDVRAWVDSSRNDGSTAPYKFRVVLDPTASRLIDETEEDRTLEDLGLTPSATLVLVAIPKFVTAGSGGGVVQSTTSLFVWFFTLITTFFSGFLGGGTAASRPEEHEMADLDQEGRQQTQRAKSSSSSRVQTLHDSARQRRDPEFYNGNSLNFEPRPDDEDQ